MTCDEIERDNTAEDYLLGRLSDQAAAEFETHYFECPRCLERVQLLEATRSQFLSAPTVAATEKRVRRLIGAVAAAAVVVIAVGVIREFPSTPATPPDASPARNIELPQTAQPADPAQRLDLRVLGAIVPPPFDAPRLRVSPTASRRTFLQAMEIYSRGDYTQAIGGLHRAIEQDPKSIPAHFYLAVSLLQLERNAEAVERLRNVVALGESPYLEDAHFFLAKAHIRQADLASARKELQWVVSMDGDRRAEASRLLSEIS